MTETIFLSASVPDPSRSPKYADTADPVAIQAAVSALVYVTLGRRKLVWGGHPAITPMVWVVASDVGVQYGDWVKLYQSEHFSDFFPVENAKFRNVIFTERATDQGTSLRVMRERMFRENKFSAAVFIGGMDGIIEERDLLAKLQPEVPILPIISTGGATSELQFDEEKIGKGVLSDLDYVRLFHRVLRISPLENRFAAFADQPEKYEDRLWKPPIAPTRG